MRKINIRPITFIGGAAAVGIAAGYFDLIYGWTAIIVCGVGLIIPFAAYFFVHLKSKNKIIKTLILFGICSVMFIGFYFYFSLSVKRYENSDIEEKIYVTEGTVDEVSYHENYDSVVLKNITLGGKSYPYKLRMDIMKKEGVSQPKTGDVISCLATVNNYSPYYYGKLSADNLVKGVKYHASINASDIDVWENKANVFQKANALILKTLEKGMSEEVYPVCYAMLTGNSGLIDGETLSTFRSAGIAHVFAVSGLHIGLISAVFVFIADKLRINKKISRPITFALILFYAGICSFSPSSVRAVIMCGAAMFSSIFGFKKDMLSNISLSALIILSVSPFYLFDAGFSLSFVCVTSLAILSAPFKSFLNKCFSVLPDKLVSGISSSVTAFIGTVPVMIYFFNGISLISIVCNILLLPILSAMYILLFFSVFLSAVTTLGGVFLFIPDILFKFIIELLLRFDFSAFNISELKFGAFAVIYYIFFFLSAGMLLLKGNTKRFLTAVCLFITVFGVAFLSSEAHYATKIIVSETGGAYTVLISSDGSDYAVVKSKGGIIRNYNSIISAMDKLGVKSLDGVFVLGDYDDCFAYLGGLDINVKIAKQYAVLNRANYFSEYFGGELLLDGFTQRIGEIKVTYPLENGKYILIETKDGIIAVSDYLDYTDKMDFSDKFLDVLICVNERTLLKASNKAGLILSFDEICGFPTAKSNGNLYYFLKNGGTEAVYKLQNST